MRVAFGKGAASGLQASSGLPRRFGRRRDRGDHGDHRRRDRAEHGAGLIQLNGDGRNGRQIAEHEDAGMTGSSW